jgi:hypothetical protein
MNYSFELLKQAVEKMTAKYKIPLSFFDCKYRKRRGKILGIKVVIDAQYLDYAEAWTSMEKWRDRIIEFYSMEFTIETFHVHINRDIRVSILVCGLEAKSVSLDDCAGNMRVGT